MDVSVRELKSRMSEYLRRVAAGEEVVVTSRGKTVARLVPPAAPRKGAVSEHEVIERLRNLPWVRSAKRTRPELPKPLIRIRESENTLAEIVRQQRG